MAGIIFDPSASAYTITVLSPAVSLTISGEGLTNNSSRRQNFVTAVDASGNPGMILFSNSASAGSGTLFTNIGGTVAFGLAAGETEFFDNATAGNATFINNPGQVSFGSGGTTQFFGSASAGNGVFTNKGSTVEFAGVGETIFFENSTAGDATFTNEGGTVPDTQGGSLLFFGTSTAGNAAVTTNAPTQGGISAFTEFRDSSTGGNATLITEDGSFPGETLFLDTSSAGNATLIANGSEQDGFGGSIRIYDSSSGGTARIEVFGKGELDINIRDTPRVTVGSIEGTGVIDLAGRELVIGNNNLSTSFSGIIEDGIGFGGSVAKIGHGQLVLTSANIYPNGTIIAGGSLLTNNSAGSATGVGPVWVKSGRLGGAGTIAGAVTIGTGNNDPRAFLLPGGRNGPGPLTIQSTLTFNAEATYRFQLNSNTARADEVAANGVTIDAAALFSSADSGNTVLASGTAFTVISNTAPAPITGTFNNLADGSTITVGSNTFQANYEGGDGNDLTLTVVP